MTIPDYERPTPNDLVLNLPITVRRELLHVVADAIRWAQDQSETQTRAVTPEVYSPALRYSTADPRVTEARGRDAAYAHSASCAVSDLAIAFGLNGLRVADIADVSQPLSLWHAVPRQHAPAGVTPAPEETRTRT